MTAPVGAIRHPLNPNAYYVGDDDGTVRVTMGTRWGRFDQSGKYLEGSLFEADPELCVWVSAPRPSSPSPHQPRARHARRAVTRRGRRGHSPGGAAVLPWRRPAGCRADVQRISRRRDRRSRRLRRVRARLVRSGGRVTSALRRDDALCVNHAIEVADERHATGEVYNVTYLRRTAEDGTAHLDTWWGRYLDEYECRDGRWAISHRVCVHEWTRSEPLGETMAIDAQRFRQGAADRG